MDDEMEPCGDGLYEKLPSRTIRLLQINAYSGSNAGTLEAVGLDTAPPYYAVSHCWGAQSPTISILIGGVNFNVCPDLAACIRRLQELSTEPSQAMSPIHYVWVDNICINQKDVHERSSQLRYMGDIYSRSIRTIVWLGPTSTHSSSAWKLVRNIHDLFKEQYHSVENLDSVPAGIFSTSLHAASGLAGIDDLQWTYLKQLFKIPWFSRIWVVQEVVLSSSDPLILHGRHIFPWSLLEGAAYWLRRNGYARLSQTAEEILNVDIIGLLRRSHVRWPLDALLSVTQMKFHASDQRDKVYSLYGLAAETHDASHQPPDLVADYTVGVTETYRKVAHYLLQHDRSLAILTRTRGTKGSLSRKYRQYDYVDFPSWLPDWSDFSVYGRDVRRSFSWVHSADNTNIPYLGFPKHYTASSSLPLELHPSPNNSLLRLGGMKVDAINRVLPLNRNDQECGPDESFASHMRGVCEVTMPLSTDENIVNWAELLIRTMTAGQHSVAGYEWEQCLKDGQAYLHHLLTSRESQVSPIISKCINITATDILRHNADGGRPMRFVALARNFCFNRTFVITSTGRMGLGPSDSCSGDIVAIIPGSGVPLIIRQVSSLCWMLVGESYIQGLMSGEGVKDFLAGILKKDIITFQ